MWRRLFTNSFENPWRPKVGKNSRPRSKRGDAQDRRQRERAHDFLPLCLSNFVGVRSSANKGSPERLRRVEADRRICDPADLSCRHFFYFFITIARKSPGRCRPVAGESRGYCRAADDPPTTQFASLRGLRIRCVNARVDARKRVRSDVIPRERGVCAETSLTRSISIRPSNPLRALPADCIPSLTPIEKGTG